MLLDITREEVDIRTHGIVHLEHHVDAQDVELEERVEKIANLEKQLLSFRCKHHLSLLTPRRSMLCRASMKTRSDRCRMRGDKILSGLG
jgi:hypothetical protein